MCHITVKVEIDNFNIVIRGGIKALEEWIAYTLLEIVKCTGKSILTLSKQNKVSKMEKKSMIWIWVLSLLYAFSLIN